MGFYCTVYMDVLTDVSIFTVRRVHPRWVSTFCGCPSGKQVSSCLKWLSPSKGYCLCGCPSYMSVMSVLHACPCFIRIYVRKVVHDVSISDKLRDRSLFMGMTGSGKNRTGFENFSCRGDGLCVFFLNKETGL